MPLFLAVFSILTLQIGLCLFGYFETEKMESSRSFTMDGHSEFMGTIR